MARVRLRGRSVSVTRKGELTTMQIQILLHGFEIGEGAAFATPAEYQGAWLAHRDGLLATVGAFCRPEAFWWVEVGIVPPGCKASPYDSEEAALLGLKLALTAQEQAILAARASEEERTKL